MQFTNIQIKPKRCLVERLATLGLGIHWKVGRIGLVEKTESHVIIFFLLGLAGELLDNGGKSGVIRFNTNRAEDGLDASGSNLITAEGSEKSCGYVTHV